MVAIAIVAFAVLERAGAWRSAWRGAFWIECSAALFLAGVALGLPRMSDRLFRWTSVVNASVCTAALLGFAFWDAGSHSLYFDYCLAVPLIATVILPRARLALFVTTGMVLVFGVVMMERDGSPHLFVVRWVGLVLLSFCYAWYSGQLHRKARHRERALREAHIEAERQLAGGKLRELHSDRLMLMGRLSASVAHEINNPLSAALSNLGYLNRELATAPVDPELRAAVAESLEGLQRISAVVCDLRRFAGPGSSSEEIESVSEVAAEALRIAGSRLRAVGKLESKLPDSPLWIKVNRGQLVQALVNLLINAGDTVEQRGRSGTVKLSAFGDASWVTFSVEDDGRGIPAELGADDVEPVLTTGSLNHGTGLGLTLIREFVRQSEGQLQQERCKGGGSRFLLRLPRQTAFEEASSAQSQQAA